MKEQDKTRNRTVTGQRVHAAAFCAVAALWLTACGGGGGGGDAAPPAPAPQSLAEGEAFPGAQAPAPAPAPTPAPGTCAGGSSGDVTGDVQAAANGSYTVTASGAGPVVVTLPAEGCLQAGDRVRVTGQGSAAWRLAQNPLQYVETVGLPGNVTPGTAWTPRTVDPAAPLQNWTATASSASGNRIAAAANGGGIWVSQDGGASWVRSNAPTADWSALSMSPDGSRLAATQRNGLLYTSSDHGLTWTARTATAQSWTGVHISEDGQRIAGVVNGGSVLLSTDGGASFTAVPGTGNTDWRGISGSASGMRLVAVASFYAGDAARQGVYVSEDGGQTWSRPAITDAADPPTGNWTFVAASHSGMRMAALDNGGFPWVSNDGGRTWNIRFGFSNWSGVAVSGDGNVVSALEPRDDVNRHTGYVFVSPDGGGSTWNWYGENRWYRAVSLSFDGHWIAVGDAGPGGSGGLLYTSQGNRTSAGTLGSITGGPGQMLEVTYQGNGRFTVSGSAGGPFTIR
jgi:photosystem II stability/assembly factor-like uncharacterized protein